MMQSSNSYKVALLSSGLGHVRRGIETWTEDLAAALNEKGIPIRLYKGAGKADNVYEKVIPCLKRDSQLSKWLMRIRPKFFWHLGFGSGYTLEETTFTLNVLPELILKKYDIIHTQDPQVADILQTLNRKNIIKSKIILAHGTEEPFEFLNRFDYIQHLAPYHLEEMRSQGQKAKQSFAIGNFVDIDKFKPQDGCTLRKELNIPDDAFVILSVAAIKRTHKRINYLIDEFSQLKNEKLYLLVVGSQTDQSKEIIDIAKKKIGDKVIFLTDFPRERMPEVYVSANVFVLCSLKEMMPIALLEALSSGLPAITHSYPVEEWMMGDGGDAIDMKQEGQLASRIDYYFQNPIYSQDKAKKARYQVVKNFSKEVIVEQIISMYKEILEERR